MGKEPFVSKSPINRKPMHYSVGAIIKNPEGKFLLINRKNVPLGFACIAGHIDNDDESANVAIRREIKEESGLVIDKIWLIVSAEMENNPCKHGIDVHYWALFGCYCSGVPQLEESGAKSIGWYSQQEIQELADEDKLEPIWNFWLLQQRIILPKERMRSVQGSKVAKQGIPLDKLKETCGEGKKVGEQCNFLCLTINGWACEKGTEMGKAIGAKAAEDNKELKIHCKE